MTDRSGRLRVLHITRNLPPLRGGMERLNLHMAIQLAREFDVAVIGPRGCRVSVARGIKVNEVPIAPLWRFFGGLLIRGISGSLQMRPDVVLAGSGLVAPFAWLAAKCVGARYVVYVHGLDLIADHPIFRWGWRPFVRAADLCIANSSYTAALAHSAGISPNRVAVVHPGVDIPVIPPQTNDFRARFDLGERPLLLSVGRLIERKGLFEFVENALPLIVATVPDVCLVVLGDEVPRLLHGSSAGLGERVRRRAAACGVADNLRFVGPQDDATLAVAYCAADVHVFPVRDIPGDVEGFGMVAVEAAAHGLPTVAFAVGGVTDAVEDGVSGHLLPAGDYPQLAAKVVELLRSRTMAHMRTSARVFAKRFAWDNFGVQIREQIRNSHSR